MTCPACVIAIVTANLPAITAAAATAIAGAVVASKVMEDVCEKQVEEANNALLERESNDQVVDKHV